MKSFIIIVQLLITSVIFICCAKKRDTPATQTARIDVYNPYGTDPNGNLLYGDLADSQWQSKTFSVDEMNLFASLDTADLTGTSTPDSVNQYSKAPSFQQRFLCNAYPNPFSTVFHLSPYFNEQFNGKTVFKFVITDSLLHALAAGAVKLQANASNHYSATSVALQPNISAGHYRLYYTLSSKTNEHFYKSWGNIEKR